jgi:predicted permease
MLSREVSQDLTYAARLLRHSPGVVVVTVAGLGLAIGVSTSIFSIVNAAMRPSGIEDPSTAVRIVRAHGSQGMGSAWPYSLYARLRQGVTQIKVEAQLTDSAAFGETSDAESTEQAGVMFVSGGYLGALTRSVTAGRLLSAGDDAVGAPPAVVVSHRFWSRRLGGDPSRVGQPIWLNGVPFTLVGVAERRFTGTMDTPPAFWVPLTTYHLVYGGRPLSDTTTVDVTVVGRLPAALPRSQAEAEVSSVAAAIGHDFSDSSGDPLTGVRLTPADRTVGPSMAARIAVVVAVVGSAIGLVLMLACVNVANLLLASAVTRQREIGIRVALGATRGRIVRQLLTESLALALVGGALGLLFTIWLVPTLTAFIRAPVTVDTDPDIRVYLALAAISMIAGLGAGLMPARHAIREHGRVPLKGQERSRQSTRVRGILITSQAAASVMLLVLAALLSRAMVQASRVDVGFDANRLLVVSPGFGRGASDAQIRAYWPTSLERLREVPGVRLATLASSPPFAGASQVTIFRRAGSRYTINHNDTQPEYFAALGLRMIRGRSYTAEEVASGAQVVVISETLARDFFPNEDPIGQTLDRAIEGSRDVVLGVVSNAITARLRDLSSACVYRPMRDPRTVRLIVRTDGPPVTVIPAVRTALQPIDPRIQLNIRPVSEGLQQQLTEPRIFATLAGLFGTIALALAIVGIYGVTAFVVGQRTQEISVRMALGASGRDVMRLLLGDSLRPVMVGLAAGVFLALLGTRVVSGVLYGLSASDPIAFGGAVLVLLTAATLAVIVPTRRAAAIDPAATLRQL